MIPELPPLTVPAVVIDVEPWPLFLATMPVLEPRTVLPAAWLSVNAPVPDAAVRVTLFPPTAEELIKPESRTTERGLALRESALAPLPEQVYVPDAKAHDCAIAVPVSMNIAPAKTESSAPIALLPFSRPMAWVFPQATTRQALRRIAITRRRRDQ